MELTNMYEFSTSMIVYIGGTLRHKDNNGTHDYNISITARNVTVASGGKIDAEGRGFKRGSGSGATGSGPGGGGGAVGGAYAGGGSHGGYGGTNGSSNAIQRVYGSISDPRDLGSAGGIPNDANSLGGNGGGAIFINATDTFNNSGIIQANATSATGGSNEGGGGAGGSILVHAGI